MTDFALIGAGAGGTFLFSRIIDELERNGADVTGKRITVINPDATFGTGTAYGPGNGEALLNRSTGRMDLAGDGRFARWVARPGAVRQALAEKEFLPRRTFGEYLAAMLRESIRRARRIGVVVDVVRDEAIGVQAGPSGGYRVDTAGSGPVSAGAVVLAMGAPGSHDQYALTGAPGYVPQAPPFGAEFEAIPDGARVGVLGSRLSGIDTALHLLSRGHTGPISLLSRGGMLPSVRGDNPAWELQAFTPHAMRRVRAREGADFGLRSVLRELSGELRLAGARFSDIGLTSGLTAAQSHRRLEEDLARSHEPVAWQSVLASTNEVISVCWQALPATHRHWFLRNLHSGWMARRVPIPVVSARALDAAIKSGAIGLVAGVHDIRAARQGFEVAAESGGERFDWIVNCTGAARTVHKGASRLTDQLLGDGIAARDLFGGLRLEPRTGRVLAADGEVQDGLYALGALTCGAHYVTSAIDVVGRQAELIAEQIVAALTEPQLAQAVS
ncbi:Uncharacterized NAD(P)/FAD-binding protein YdhS [Amycolatopsis xylanica]|uniref:Uncharacterized NAD(P)/FAD-binding protein YdhS n=1 Tax=Amycolatopsis xylanica TaxID=589385 RepID=A0A1H3EYB7_9PSEU|nr:FAD/NAD(P)-binding protein [Amycolatopsis xylanica]SDX82959.1 Uncharacterized NAD(P)/FAD-binding protein YdhS [Amycolatopsis xylanica]